MAGRDPMLSGLFYLPNTCQNLDVTPESALALIRGLGEYSEPMSKEIPDRARRAPFRDDTVEKSRKISRTVVGVTRPSSGDFNGVISKRAVSSI